jgi:hypothetical protein
VSPFSLAMQYPEPNIGKSFPATCQYVKDSVIVFLLDRIAVMETKGILKRFLVFSLFFFGHAAGHEASQDQ